MVEQKSVTLQDRQCMYNVTLSALMKPLLPWKSNKQLDISLWCVRSCVCVRASAQAWACVALPIQHKTRRHIVICGLSGSTIFFDISHKRYDFREKRYWA
jgi:hypothetical protein